MDTESEVKFAFQPHHWFLISVAAAAFLSIVGYWLGAGSGDPLWVSRFGSLIILYAILQLLFLKWKSGDLENADNVWERQVKRAIDASTSSAVDHAAQRFASEVNVYGRHVRGKWFYLSESFLLFYGTALWGFGDLFAERFLRIVPCSS